ncbi:MAG: hypothetical protein ACREYF_05235 [Gammaproteobacteria bacterium]
MNTAERIYEQVKGLPEPLAREVLDFVGYLRAKLEHGDVMALILAQQQSLADIWDNTADDAWNNV